MELGRVERERVAAVAVRLINLGWFRVGSERYARESRTYGITTLTKRHVAVRGSRIAFSLPRQAQRPGPDASSSTPSSPTAVRELLDAPRGRALFRYVEEGEPYNLTGARLNDYVREHLGDEFTAKDFRTWGGTLIAAIALAEHGAGRDGDRGEARRRAA